MKSTKTLGHLYSLPLRLNLAYIFVCFFTKYDNSSCDKRQNIYITDLYNSIHDVPQIPGPNPEIFKKPKKSIIDHFARMFTMFDMKFWLLLAITGVCCGISGVFVDYMSVYIWKSKNPVLLFHAFNRSNFFSPSQYSSSGIN